MYNKHCLAYTADNESRRPGIQAGLKMFEGKFAPRQLMALGKKGFKKLADQAMETNDLPDNRDK